MKSKAARDFAEFAVHASRRYVEHLFDWFHRCFPLIFRLLHLRGSRFTNVLAEIAAKTRQVFHLAQ